MRQRTGQCGEVLPAQALRVAFFGGSFDPPHHGHLAVARAAQQALQLDRVLFVPVGAQPLKPAGSSAEYEDRVEMTRLAIQAEPTFVVSRADAPREDGAPNYSFQTLSMLRAELPAGSLLYFLMGADSFAGLHRWFRAGELPFLAPLIVASRPGERLDDLRGLLPDGVTLEPNVAERPLESQESLQSYVVRNAAGEQAPFYLLPELEVEISATAIREELCCGDPARAARLLSSPVSDYIHRRKLYQ